MNAPLPQWMPDEPKTLDALDEALLRLLRVYQRPGYRKRLLHGLSASIELSTLRTLRAVQRSEEAPSVGALADTLMIEPSTCSRLVDGAADSGLISRSTCTEDRRRVRLHLTAAGQDVLEEVTARRRQLLAEVTSGWDPNNLQGLVELLSALLSGFEELESSS